MIIAAVSFDRTDSLVAVAADAGIPVVDLVNGMTSARVAARSVMPYYDAGHAAGIYLAKRHPEGSAPATVAWFPGPKGPGWTVSGDRGFREAIRGAAIQIVDARWGDTGKRAQTDLLNQALEIFPDVDYVVGTSVTAEAAERVLRRRKLKDTLVVASYFSPGVLRGIKQGKILAAPTDSPVIQARIAVDQLVRILDKAPVRRHIGTRVQTVTPENVTEIDQLNMLAPTGFIATYSVN